MNEIVGLILVVATLGGGFFWGHMVGKNSVNETDGPPLNFVPGQAPWSIQTAEGCYYWRDKGNNFAGYWLLTDGVTAKCNGAKNKK